MILTALAIFYAAYYHWSRSRKGHHPSTKGEGGKKDVLVTTRNRDSDNDHK